MSPRVPTLRARCLKSSVVVMRPTLQSGLRYGFRHCTMNCDICARGEQDLALPALTSPRAMLPRGPSGPLDGDRPPREVTDPPWPWGHSLLS